MLSVADHISDSKGVALITHIFKEVLSFPPAPNWISTIQEVFAKLHGPDMPLSRRAIALHVRSLYDDVRDLAGFRDPLVQCSLESWQSSLLKEENDETITDVLAILGDAIVAGAADEQSRDRVPSLPSQDQSANGLDHRIVDLLVRVAARCECPEDSHAGSDRTTLQSTYSGDLSADVADAGVTPPPPPPGVTSPLREPSSSPALAYPPHSAGFTAAADTESHPLPPELFLPHETACKSLSAVLTLILAFNRLGFSPPHSLDADSPFKTARAPASSKCIQIFESLLSLLGPTNTTTSLPLGERRKPGHEQASCRRARLAILQWSVRLRADRDHRLYFKDDLTADVDPFAQLLGRGISTNLSRSSDAQMEGESDARLGRKGRTLMRRDREAQGRPQTSSESRSQSRYAPAPESRTPYETSPQEQLWNLPDSLPFTVPSDASRPSEGITTYTDQREREKELNNVAPDLWLSVSTYVCILTDLMEDDSDWEIFSYTLCHLPLQLSNKHLFCGPRARESICNMVTTMCNSMLSDRFGSKARIPSPLRNTDVWGLACQVLTIFVGYRDAFKLRERQLGETLVKTFCYGLNRHVSVAKPCLQALAICAYEFESATAKYLPQVLDHLVQVISKPGISRQVLELLAILGKMPTMYSNLRNSHFDTIFSTAGRYIQRHNRPPHMNISTAVGAKIENESFSLSQHVLVLAYYVVYIWYLGIERPERGRYIPTISRFLWIANSGQTAMDEMTEVCFDWLKRYTVGDVVPRPTHDAVLCEPNDNSKSWLLGNAIMTIESLQARGWVGATVRGASGVIQLTIRVDNLTSQRFEEIDPHTLLPRSASAASADGGASVSPMHHFCFSGLVN
jgi:tuberous sclerosis protein 2